MLPRITLFFRSCKKNQNQYHAFLRLSKTKSAPTKCTFCLFEESDGESSASYQNNNDFYQKGKGILALLVDLFFLFIHIFAIFWTTAAHEATLFQPEISSSSGKLFARAFLAARKNRTRRTAVPMMPPYHEIFIDKRKPICAFKI